MPHYIYDDTDLDFPKIDANTLPSGADPTQFILGDNWNKTCQALVDVKDVLRSMKIIGFAAQVTDPLPPGIADYMWISAAGILHVKRGGTNHRVVYESRKLLGSAGVEVSDDGTLAQDLTLSLAPVSPSPAGSYTRASVTIDEFGRVVTASSNTGAASYSTMRNDTVDQTERLILQVDGTTLILEDNPTDQLTSLRLADTAVAPGSYNYASFTVDQQGRITTASNGNAPAPETRSLTAGNGLAGGGDLSTDRSFEVNLDYAFAWTEEHSWDLGTSPLAALSLLMTQPGTAGQRDSHNLLMRGTSFDTSGHNSDWRSYVDVTSNAGASRMVWESRVDAAGFVSQMSLDDAGVILANGLGIKTSGAPAFALHVNDHIGLGAATLPAGYHTTYYKGVWFPNNVAYLAEENAAWAGHVLASNLYRKNSPNEWGQADVSRPSWVMNFGHGTNIDKFQITRTPAGQNPNSVLSVLFQVSADGTVGIGTGSPGAALDVAWAAGNSIQMRAGSTAGLSIANTGRFRHNESTQRLQMSMNGAAYVNVPTPSEVVAPSLTLTAGVGLSGGGDLSANRTFDLEDTIVAPGAYVYASITVDQQGRLTAASNGMTPALAAQIFTAGAGLVGGGDLTADRSFEVDLDYVFAWTEGHSWDLGTSPLAALSLLMAQPGVIEQRDSHNIVLRGTSFDTVGHDTDWRFFVNVTEDNGASHFIWQNQIDAGGWLTKMEIDDAGTLFVPGLKQTTGNVGFFNTTPVAQQSADAFTNSMTAGGTDDTVVDYTVVDYATDASTIHNNQYQLARKLAEVVTGLRNLGLFA